MDYKQEFLDAARYGEIDDLCLMGRHEELKKLIDFQNLLDPESGNSPLMLASANGHLDCVQFLVTEIGVPVNYKNFAGNSALHWAALNGHAHVVEFLIANSADVNMKNTYNRTPFEEALVRDRKDCCEIIAKEEVRIEMMNDDGEGEDGEIMMDEEAS